MKLQELDALEDRLIDQYEAEVERIINQLDDANFKALLPQRKWVSYSFTPLYDYGIDGVQNEAAKKVLRAIRNAEYPAAGPSHREDLVHDLKAIGISMERVMNTPPLSNTLQIVRDDFEYLKLDEPQDLHDIKVVAFLRFAKEVLVSPEYGVYLKRLKRMGLPAEKSRFYQEHYEHDMKKTPLGKSGASHADALANVLVKMLDSPEKIRFCADVTRQAYTLRKAFFKPFI